MIQSTNSLYLEANFQGKIDQSERDFFQKEVSFHAHYPEELDPKKPLSNGEIAKIVLLSTVLLPLGVLIVLKKVACWAVWAFANFLVKVRNSKLSIVNLAILPAIGTGNYFSCLPSNIISKKIKTPDGVDLEAMMIWKDKEEAQKFTQNNDSSLVSKNNWVVFHLPNGATVQDLAYEAADWPKNYNCNFLFYNYRGVGNSGKTFDLNNHKLSRIEPKTQKELILDGVTAYQYLISHNVSPEKICSVGYSLGGGVATQVASIYPTHIANIKSFSSISKVCEGFLTPERGPKVWKFVGTGLAKLVGWILSGVLNEANWNLNTGEIWPTLKTHKWIVTGKNDEVINYPARLGTYLKEKGLLGQDEELILEEDRHDGTGLSIRSRTNCAWFHHKNFSEIFPYKLKH